MFHPVTNSLLYLIVRLIKLSEVKTGIVPRTTTTTLSIPIVPFYHSAHEVKKKKET